jgi:hypothetical protein
MRKTLVLFLLLQSSYSLGETSNVIDLPGAPLQVTSYQAVYEQVDADKSHAIVHLISVANNGSQDVVAFSMGFLSFNSFNEFMGSPLVVYMMDAIEAGTSSSRPLGGIQRPQNGAAFRGYGTGFAYVMQARLEDGTIWEADLALVLEELRKIQSSLSLDEINEVE